MNKQFEECKSPYSPTALVQREYLQALHERIEKLEAENQKFREALSELVDLVEDARDGSYTIDSFTLQPARAVLQKLEGGK